MSDFEDFELNIDTGESLGEDETKKTKKTKVISKFQDKNVSFNKKSNSLKILNKKNLPKIFNQKHLKNDDKSTSKLSFSDNQNKMSIVSKRPFSEDKNSTFNVNKKNRKEPEQEDPQGYHKKPFELSTHALDQPRAILATSDKIFSENPFSLFNLDLKLVEILEKSKPGGGLGLSRTTNVQSVSIPILNERSNLLMRSQTGSGKTLAFLIPIINDIMSIQPKVKREEGTRALIICPTRELCYQIEIVISSITNKTCCNVVSGCVSGGEKKKSEKARLRRGIVILVATPGRLLDHLKTTESFTLNNLRWIVLDEADRLLDMGFEKAILEILSIIRGENIEARSLGKFNPNDPGGGGAGGGGGGGVIDLKSSWKRQNASKAKISNYKENLIHVMSSATLPNSVLLLSAPILGYKSFSVIDADRKFIERFESSDQLLDSDIFKNSKKQESSCHDNIISFETEFETETETETAAAATTTATSSEKKQQWLLLEKGEFLSGHVESLQQYYMMTTCKWRLAALACFLKQHAKKKIIVFFSTCDSVDYHSFVFREATWPEELDEEIPYDSDNLDQKTNKNNRSSSNNNNKTSDKVKNTNTGSIELRKMIRKQMGKDSLEEFLDPLDSATKTLFDDESKLYRLHGNISQSNRQLVYKEFSVAKQGILFCTDVAARGLDFADIDWILQYDPPCETIDYVHRVGRTARKGLSGQSLIFLLPSESNYISLLSSHGLSLDPISLQSLFYDSIKFIPGAKKFKNSEEMSAIILQRRFERVVLSNKYLSGAAQQAFRSYIRAYATHSLDTKGIFKIQFLHLGHVAKSFALRENPSNLRDKDDILTKILMGEYSLKSIKENGYAKDNSNNRGGIRRTLTKKNNNHSQINSKKLKASGNFRKSGGGYFKSKLRNQSKMEFSA